MSERLTIEEMRAKYPDEWILVENPQMSEKKKVLAGTVNFHSKVIGDLYRQATGSKSTVWAFVFTGTFPRDTAFILRLNSSMPTSPSSY